MSPTTPGKQGLALGNKILVGVLAGIAVGVFLGEQTTPFKVVGRIYVSLLQMTVLPYVIVSLVTKIGRLSFGQARKFAGRAGLVLLALWVISLPARHEARPQGRLEVLQGMAEQGNSHKSAPNARVYCGSYGS